MHLVESFALNTGLRIGKPEIIDKFIPLAFQDSYITLQPQGAFPCRKYDYWNEVIEILKPVLLDNHIQVVQLGKKDEDGVVGAYDMRGKTTFCQAAYLIKNALLHVGVDSFGIHFASGYNKKIVGLYSNMLPENSGPYWSNSNDVRIHQPPREQGQRPSYKPEEDPKTINKINPEDIAESICNLLGVSYEYPYKTLYIGKDYLSKKVELIPVTHLTNYNILEVDSLIMRMDRYFDESVLLRQLQICKCSIVTNKPINIDILLRNKDRIIETVFLLDDVDQDISEYLTKLKESGIKFFLMSNLPDDELNKIKLKYIDIAPILPKDKYKKQDIDKILRGKNYDDIYFKTSALNVLRTGVYAGHPFTEGIKPVNLIKNIPPQKMIMDEVLWQDINHFLILEKVK
tara:strand:+ start:616 stop:1818 length:1203 start_codon:yes stop_codon:yes gene_type:complete